MRHYLKNSLLAAATVSLALGLGAANAADFTMKFGTATVNEDQHQYIKFLKEELEKASGGKIAVEIYPQSQLGNIQRHSETAGRHAKSPILQ